MDPNERMLIERECERLVTAYCHYIDHGEARRVADLFSDDGTWSGPGTQMNGKAELLAGFTARENRTELRSRHVCQNFLCDVIDEDTAEGVVYLTLYRRNCSPDEDVVTIDGPSIVGEYRDRFVRTENGWRISERICVVSFARSG